MKCPHCQTENPDGAQFCGVCGQSLASERTCPQCGHVNPKQFKLCNKCAYALVESVPQPASSVPTSFTGGRYQVKKLLGEGRNRKVHLAHDDFN